MAGPKKNHARDYRKLEILVKANRRDTLSDITLKFNENNVNPVAKRTLQYHLNENGFKRGVQRKKLVITEVNRKKKTVVVPGKAEMVG